MADNDFYKIDRLPPAKTKVETQTHIKDGELQFQLSNVKDTSQVEGVNFKNILASLNQTSEVRGNDAAGKVYEREDVHKAMEDAANSFEAMMQIQKEIENAYQELRQMLT